MAKLNLTFIKGSVITTAVKTHPNGVEECIAVVGIIRGYRYIGDQLERVKIDKPVIMSRRPEIVSEMKTWKTNAIVSIKGALATRRMLKSSICPECGNVNTQEGTLEYIEPIFVEKHFDAEDKETALAYLHDIREISNQVYVMGNLATNPKKISPKKGLIVTQYMIGVDRKYTIREDSPEIRSDFPWIKSYGQNAISDREFLHQGSLVLIDGCLQARNVNRKSICETCSAMYGWKDRALEVVPYETEYLSGFYTPEEREENRKRLLKERLEARGLGNLLDGQISEELIPDYDEITDEDIERGIDTYEEEE